MPIYEYQCEKCGQITERRLSMENPDPGKCENCGSSRMKKLFSTFAADVKNSPTASGNGHSCQGGACGCSSGSCPF